MKGFVFITSKNKKVKLTEEVIKNTIDNLKGVKHDFKIISRENMTLVCYTNERISLETKKATNILACPIGQFVTDKKTVIHNLIHSTDLEKRSMVSTMQGTFLLAIGNLEKKRIDIFTHITRIESAYIFESTNDIVCGTDPIIVSALSNESLNSQFEPSNFVSFFELGYFADENTPYRNVRCLPENSHIIIEKNKLCIIPIDDSYNNIFQDNVN